MKTGAELITDERETSRSVWSAEHDLLHNKGELKMAALYALTLKGKYRQAGFQRYQISVFHDTELVRLKKAGALIAAEMDRIIAVEGR